MFFTTVPLKVVNKFPSDLAYCISHIKMLNYLALKLSTSPHVREHTTL